MPLVVLRLNYIKQLSLVQFIFLESSALFGLNTAIIVSFMAFYNLPKHAVLRTSLTTLLRAQLLHVAGTRAHSYSNTSLSLTSHQGPGFDCYTFEPTLYHAYLDPTDFVRDGSFLREPSLNAFKFSFFLQSY